MTKKRKSVILPPMPSLHRVIAEQQPSSLQTGLENKQKSSVQRKSINSNSEKWLKNPPKTLRKMIELNRQLEKSSQWLQKQKN